MTIYFLTSGLGRGGAEKQLLLIAARVAAGGIPCEIVVIGGHKSQAGYPELLAKCYDARVTIRYVDTWRALFALAAQRIGRSFARERASITWTWGYRAELLRLLLLPFGRGVFSIRSASESQARRWRWLLCLGRFHTWRYISNSHLGIEIADRIAPGIALKSCVVPNALESALLATPANPGGRPLCLEVMMLGNVRYGVKGYDIALDVGKLIRAAGLPIRIRIAGAQYEGEPSLAAEIHKASVGDVVAWEGSAANPLGFLQSGSAFMLLSRYEGMPNALFEAMALGLPCIATAVGDLPRYAKESKGLKVIPVADAEAAFRELCWIWNNWDEAVAMGERAKQFCQDRFSEERMIGDVIRALELEPCPANLKVESVI